jgi:HEAT repeats
MRKTLGMNKHQKAVYRVGEQRVGRDEIPKLLEMSQSADPDERATAAQFLCPCHVRRRIEAVWEALYRLLEDPDVRVRRAAWHTLEDGGRPDDPALDAILERVLRDDTDPRVLDFARKLAGPRREKEKLIANLAARPQPKQRGRCDFCGEDNIPVERDLETMIPTGDLPRPALICERCQRANVGR